MQDKRSIRNICFVEIFMDFIIHFSGVGPPLSPERTRALLALRINVMAKGFSGISLHVLSHYIDAFNGTFSAHFLQKTHLGLEP